MFFFSRMSDLSSEHAQLLLLSWSGGSRVQEPSSKLSLPNRVTTAKRGPLSLNASTKTESKKKFCAPRPLLPFLPPPPPLQHPHQQPSRKRHTLTQFSVLMVQRPMDLVEQELDSSHLSCAELSETLAEWIPQRSKSRALKLPHVTSHLQQHCKRSTPSMMERVTHTSEPGQPMDIAITYSKFSDPTVGPTTNNHPTSTSQQTRQETKKSYKLPGLQQSSITTHGQRQASLAPASMLAAVTHRLKPINKATFIKGEAISKLKD